MPVNLIPIALKALRSPWLYLALISLAAAYYRHDARSAHAAFDKLKAEYIADSQMAATRQYAENANFKARERALATQVDLTHAKAVTNAHGATERFIRDNSAGRLCASGGRSASEPDPAAQGANPGVSERAPAEAVMVSAGDVRACTDAAVYAQSAFDWSQRLKAEGLGE